MKFKTIRKKDQKPLGQVESYFSHFAMRALCPSVYAGERPGMMNIFISFFICICSTLSTIHRISNVETNAWGIIPLWAWDTDEWYSYTVVGEQCRPVAHILLDSYGTRNHIRFSMDICVSYPEKKHQGSWRPKLWRLQLQRLLHEHHVVLRTSWYFLWLF